MLGLQEALKSGDTVIEGDRPVPRRKAKSRLREFVSPAAWRWR